MAEYGQCPKCRGKLVYNEGQDLFVCEGCGNRFFREMIVSGGGKSTGTNVYCAPARATGCQVQLTSQYEGEKALPASPPTQSVRLDDPAVPKSEKPKRRMQKQVAEYDRAQEKREEERRLAAEAIGRAETSMSEELYRANLLAVGTPRPTEGDTLAVTRENGTSQMYLTSLPQPDLGASDTQTELPAPQTVADMTPTIREERLKLAVKDAELALAEKKATHRRLSQDIWKMEPAPGQSRRAFRQSLSEANQAIDRAALEIKEAKIALKEAKRAYRRRKKN